MTNSIVMNHYYFPNYLEDTDCDLELFNSIRKFFPVSTSFLLKITIPLFWESQKRGESDPFRQTPLFKFSPNAARGTESPRGRDSSRVFGWIGLVETRLLATTKRGDDA